MIRRLTLVVWLLLLWVVLWRDLSIANVFSGLVVALVVTFLVGQPRAQEPSHRLRPIAVVAFGGYFAWKLVEANIVLAREVLTRRDTTRPGVIAVRLHPASDLLTTIIANAISLTPGTLTLEVRQQPRTLYVHVLHLHDEARTRREIRHLELLIRKAHGYSTPTEEPPAEDRRDSGEVPS